MPRDWRLLAPSIDFSRPFILGRKSAPVDSWERELDDNEFEVERIADVRSGRRTRSSRALLEYLIYWKGSPNPSWIEEANLNCGTLLRNCERKQTGRNRFEMKNSQEE
ncbi:hypothetical protein PC119_g11517 [Phytophthora cactorum]|nr:hypothetical protein PC119_g11517 [Phytophthora cactorum]